MSSKGIAERKRDARRSNGAAAALRFESIADIRGGEGVGGREED